MPSIDDFRTAVAMLNHAFPRSGLTLTVVGPFDVNNEYTKQYPSSDSPGIYALVASDGVEVLRVGKAQTLGFRLGAYFKWESVERGKGIARHPGYEDVRYVFTVGLPNNRAFEASSIEEFVLNRLSSDPPRLNVRLGRIED